MKRTKSGFTVVELLTVIGIVALLVGVLLPAVSYVRRTAQEANQEVQIKTIDLALTAFKSDYRDYPPSDGWDYETDQPLDYCGSQKLAEALLGWDLLGFHPNSDFTSNGRDALDTVDIYQTTDENLSERKGPYLELSTANAFRLGVVDGVHDGLFNDVGDLHPDRFVLCDVFNAKKITVVKPLTDPPEYVMFNAGTPILYFKANTLSKSIEPPLGPFIYDRRENSELIKLGRVKDGRPHELDVPPAPIDDFIFYIMDPKVSTDTKLWPYRPDSYILISAGADGLYGTADDITNF